MNLYSKTKNRILSDREMVAPWKIGKVGVAHCNAERLTTEQRVLNGLYTQITVEADEAADPIFDDVAGTVIITKIRYVPPTYAIAQKIQWVKDEAERRILTFAPDWQQRNMLARSAELIEIVLFGGELTQEQQGEREAIKGAKAVIQAIRDYSNYLETTLTNETTLEDVQSSGWPEYS